MPTLSIKNLSVTIGEKQLLKGIDIALASSNCCVVVGKNGAGKSTFFNAIVDLIPISAQSEILINGNRLTNNERRYKTSIGYSKGDAFLIEDFTVEDNLRFLKEVYHINQQIFSNQVAIFANYFPLIKYLLKREVKNLSTGEYKLTSLLTSLLHNPEILIWDEPFANLDIETIDKLVMFIDYLLNENKIVLISSHEESIINQVGTHILVIRNGYQSFFAEKKLIIENGENIKKIVKKFI